MAESETVYTIRQDMDAYAERRPSEKDMPLFSTNASSGWREGPGGHPQTDRAKDNIFLALEWPQRFEIDLEFASTERPRFVLALGKNLEQTLRLETWANELVC